VCALVACSSSDNSGNDGNPSGSGATSGGGAGNGAAVGNGSTTGAGNDPGVIFSNGGTGHGLDESGGATSASICAGDSSGCVGDRYAGEQIPLDIYIMFDVSCSMSCPSEETGPGLCCRGGPNPRIDQVRSATETFLKDPMSSGMGVGIGYFGFMPGGQTSCDPSKYSMPSVPIGTLPGNVGALTASLDAAQPTGK